MEKTRLTSNNYEILDANRLIFRFEEDGATVEIVKRLREGSSDCEQVLSELVVLLSNDEKFKQVLTVLRQATSETSGAQLTWLVNKLEDYSHSLKDSTLFPGITGVAKRSAYSLLLKDAKVSLERDEQNTRISNELSKVPAELLAQIHNDLIEALHDPAKPVNQIYRAIDSNIRVIFLSSCAEPCDPRAPNNGMQIFTTIALHDRYELFKRLLPDNLDDQYLVEKVNILLGVLNILDLQQPLISVEIEDKLVDLIENQGIVSAVWKPEVASSTVARAILRYREDKGIDAIFRKVSKESSDPIAAFLLAESFSGFFRDFGPDLILCLIKHGENGGKGEMNLVFKGLTEIAEHSRSINPQHEIDELLTGDRVKNLIEKANREYENEFELLHKVKDFQYAIEN